MNENSSGKWRRASPYALLYFFGSIVKSLAKNATQTIAPLAAFLVAWQGDIADKLVLAAAGLVAVIAIGTLLRFLYFRFRVEDNSLQIRDGVVRKKQLTIRFDRIQSVSAEQNPVYRLLGLVTLRFDTAGSGKTEGVLPAVSFEDAAIIQAAIRGSGESVADSENTEPPVELTELLLSLDWRDMLRIGLADWRALALLAVLGPLVERAGDQVDNLIASYAEGLAAWLLQYGKAGGATILLSALLLILLLFATLSVCAAFLRFHDYRLYRYGDRMRSIGGLLTRHENAMRLTKVQVLRYRQGMVLRLFDRMRLAARQASSDGRESGQRHFIVPLVTPTFADSFARLVFQPEAAGTRIDPAHAGFKRVSPYFMRSRLLFVAALPALCACALFIVAHQDALGAIALAWLPFASLMVFLAWRRTAYLYDEDSLQRRSGVIGTGIDAFLLRKVQRVSLSQTWFQQRRKLANLQLFLASGSISIPCIPIDDAKRLRDFILFRVESSDKAWH